MATLTVEYKDLTQIKPYAANSRTHSPKQIEQIIASIKEFGFTNPILISEDDTIIAGHGRLQAAEALGLDSVPTITLEGLTDEQKRAYVIADNKLALNAGWDFNLLESELQFLQEKKFDLPVLGFNSKELDDLLGGSLAVGVDDFGEVGETQMAHKCPRCHFEFD